MYTTLLCIQSPMQSWGDDKSKFEKRGTWDKPSKSGITGLLAAAFGRDRGEDISDLAALRFGTRVDVPGKKIRDFHIFAPDEKPDKQNVVSDRYYLCDATFLVGLESESLEDHETIKEALAYPYYPLLYLGRKSCPVTPELYVGIREKSLEQALEEEPWIASDYMKMLILRRHPRLESPKMKITVETKFGEPIDGTINDYPISFSLENRCYSRRGYRCLYKPEVVKILTVSDHDLFAAL